ncbi:TetR/AcrR family transcriptional regulator [Kineosporia babensis]|uniref:TetR/AcrR family transcriptional regulator n=1 Tax=Kineosporia babensis TaxID=499548 RepID=A0A9X1NBF9_9ACTN|nr:TetR/AcrR family transcriptional regulator [Kineosporia babensis]MCD5309978.1 TetR/AcrR family transcriptional regulator [Kineosporia babensis]
MPTKPTIHRDKERTRQAIREAAERLLAAHGVTVKIGDIAEAAGVSKSGLLHHFPSKDSLLVAVAEEGTANFRRKVLEAVDLSENRPGKLLRAYVRTMCPDDGQAPHLFLGVPWETLMPIEGVRQALEADEDHWEQAFAQDGLDLAWSRIVRYAADRTGEAAAHEHSRARVDLPAMRETLLAMAEPTYSRSESSAQ